MTREREKSFEQVSGMFVHCMKVKTLCTRECVDLQLSSLVTLAARSGVEH